MKDERPGVGNRIYVRDATGIDHEGTILPMSDGIWLVLRNGSPNPDWIRRKYIVSWSPR